MLSNLGSCYKDTLFALLEKQVIFRHWTLIYVCPFSTCVNTLSGVKFYLHTKLPPHSKASLSKRVSRSKFTARCKVYWCWACTSTSTFHVSWACLWFECFGPVAKVYLHASYMLRIKFIVAIFILSEEICGYKVTILYLTQLTTEQLRD